MRDDSKVLAHATLAAMFASQGRRLRGQVRNLTTKLRSERVNRHDNEDARRRAQMAAGTLHGGSRGVVLMAAERSECRD
jgi:hypothetical protein